MQTYMNKRKTPDRAVPPVQEAAPSRSEMLHLSGAGAPQPMSPQLREKFEPGFGADFSNIRISRGHIPEEMGVEAVAQGTDILLDERAGMDVLGHELAHVVQQAQGRVESGFPVVENAALEHEADVMGARVSSGLTAEAGPQNGFGGEITTIAPMSSASAPAQCKSGKSKEEKKMDKMQISAPTQAQIGTPAYHNAALSSSELKFARQSGATEHGAAMAQMLGGMQDPAFMQRVVAHTGSSEEEIRKEMGSLVGSEYASRALQLDPHGSDIAQRDAAMFRGNDLEHLNLGKFLQGELAGSMGGTVDTVRNSTMTQTEDNGRITTSLDPSMVDAQIGSLGTMAASSPTAMSAVDGFLRGMRQGGSDLSDQHLEGKISNEVFLRGITPVFVNASAEYAGEERKKLAAMGNNLQSKINHSQINLVPGRMSQVAPVPAPAPQADDLPEGVEISDPVYEEIEEAPAAQKEPLSPYEEMMGMLAQAERNRAIPRESFDEMTDEKGNLLDAATISARANAEFPASRDEMISMFDPKTMPRREAKAATQAAEEKSFYNSMQSMFDDEAVELEESLPHAPVEGNEEAIFSGLGAIDGSEELEDEEAEVARMEFATSSPLRPFERPSYGKYLDSMTMGPVVGDEESEPEQPQKQKKHRWQFWK